MLPVRRPAIAILSAILLPASALCASETLVFQIGKGDALLNPVTIEADYGQPPEIDNPDGHKWSDQEKDSAWSDGQGWNLRYDHAFQAMRGSRQGYGVDHIYLIDNPEDFSGTPHYTSILSFDFPGDTYATFSWEPAHMAEVPEAYPYGESAFEPGRYGEVYKRVRVDGKDSTEGQWARLLTREIGWIGYPAPSPLARGPAAEGGMDRWLFHALPGMSLQVPSGATALRLFDIQGRKRFETRALVEGGTVSLPEGLSRRALRVDWRTGPR